MTSAEATALQTLDGALSAKVAELGLSGASVALYKPGYERPLLRGFGSMTPDSAIMIASVSKVFVGGAAAKIFELGLATPDDEIPSSFRNPSFPDTPIKWRDLLTHRSSLARDVVGCCSTKKAPSYGRRDGLNEHNPTCPLDDLEGWYTKYLTGAGETSVGGTTEWWTDQFEECVDTDNGAKDSEGFGCANGYSGGFSHLCGSYDDDDFSSLVMCCACDPNASDYPLSKKWKNDKPGSEPAATSTQTWRSGCSAC